MTFPGGSTGTWGGGHTLTMPPPPVQQDLPALVGNGPAECSSCTELSVLPGVIFDVNGYYRELGVSTRATRKELRIAYQAKDGQSSPRLTYIFRQLLDPETRFAYDCVPLGELFLDEYVKAALNRIAKERAAQQMSRLADMGIRVGEEVEESLLRDAFASMGLQTEPDTPVLTFDSGTEIDKHSSSPAKFAWSYYVWRARPGLDEDGHQRLTDWQAQLVSALARAGVRTSFSVGLHGGIPHHAVLAEVGFRLVFFLRIDVSPSEALATNLVDQYVLDRERNAPSPLTER